VKHSREELLLKENNVSHCIHPLLLQRAHNQHYISVFLKNLVFLQAEKMVHHLLVIRRL
jgi:hypothetical protein